MSLRSENNLQMDSKLKELMEKNSRNMAEYDNSQFELKVYSIPEKQRSAELKMIQDMIEFQPELYMLIKTLATKTEISNMSKAMLQNLLDENRSIMSNLISTNATTVAKMENLLQQDGKMRDEYILKFSKTLDKEANKLSQTTDMLKQHLLKFLGITVGAATLFSTLVSVLLQLWLR